MAPRRPIFIRNPAGFAGLAVEEAPNRWYFEVGNAEFGDGKT